MRVMAIDYGDARTGVAISDPSGLLTGFTTVIHSRNRETVLAQLAALFDPPISKSCLNHRIRKIMEEARKL